MSTVAIHLDGLLEPLAGCLSPDVAVKVADLRADKAVQDRIDAGVEHREPQAIEAGEARVGPDPQIPVLTLRDRPDRAVTKSVGAVPVAGRVLVERLGEGPGR